MNGICRRRFLCMHSKLSPMSETKHSVSKIHADDSLKFELDSVWKLFWKARDQPSSQQKTKKKNFPKSALTASNQIEELVDWMSNVQRNQPASITQPKLCDGVLTWKAKPNIRDGIVDHLADQLAAQMEKEHPK